MSDTFKYDPFGRRIEKVSPTTTSIFAYDGDNVVETVNASSSTVARYTQAEYIDEPLAMQRGSTTDYYEADDLGSITSLTATNGSVAQSYTYDSFGNTTNSSGSVTNFFRYAAREFDTETNLYYYRARYYDPSVGRFTSEDPIQFSAGVNFYRYAYNNPNLLTDATGKDPGVIALPFVGGGEAAGALGVGGAVGGAAIGGWLIGRGIGNLPIGGGQTVDDAVTNALAPWWVQYSRGQSDPYKFSPTNPGKEPCGKCKPCPPDSPYWITFGDGHGSKIAQLKWIKWNQDPQTCMCYPDREVRGL